MKNKVFFRPAGDHSPRLQKRGGILKTDTVSVKENRGMFFKTGEDFLLGARCVFYFFGERIEKSKIFYRT